MTFRFSLAIGLLLAFSACPNTSGPCKTSSDCAKSAACCDGRCLDVQNDKSNCGGCGVVCETPNATPSCRGGSCQFQCTAGFGNCNGDKTDGCEKSLTAAADTCGLCTRSCSAPNSEPLCRASLCALGACHAGFADCDLDPTNGCELDTQGDVANCGRCGNRCQLAHATSRCADGGCEIAQCATDFGDCDVAPGNGCEVSLQTDAMHCGRCDKVCGPGQYCAASRCRAQELIVFGGTLSFSGSTTSSDVTRFDLMTKQFTVLTPAAPGGSPSPRTQHVAAWDGTRNRMLIWGGVDGAGTPAADDMWALDFASSPPVWRKVSSTGTRPSPRFGAAFAVDERTETLFLFGGTSDLGMGLSDLWTYAFATDTWTRVHDHHATDAPGDRLNSSGAFDPVTGVFLLGFGSDSTTRQDLAELWVFEPTTAHWRMPIRMGPSGRGRAALFSSHPAYLFSGAASLLMAPAAVLSDFHALDLDAGTPWSALTAFGPDARFATARTTRDGLLYLVAGGTTGSSGASTFSDVWTFDPAQQRWTRLFDGSGTSPAGKIGATVVAR